MKLNLRIFEDELKPIDFSSFYFEAPEVLSSLYPVPFVSGSNFDEKVIVVTKSCNLPEKPQTMGSPSLICIGKPPETYLKEPFNTLWTTEEVDENQLLKFTLEIFEKYRQWEDDLLQVISNNEPLKNLATVSMRFIKNPICLARTSFKVMFHAIDPTQKLSSSQYQSYCEDYGTTQVPVPDGSFLHPENIQEMISDPRYLMVSEATRPIITTLGETTHKTLCMNIRTSDGTCFARLLVDELYHEFTDKDIALLGILNDYLVEYVQVQDADDLEKPFGFDELVNNLLSQTPYDDQILGAVMRHYNWDINDSFLCMILESKSFEQDTKKLEAFAVGALPNLSSDFFAVFDGCLVFVFNLSKTQLPKEDILKQATPLLRDDLFIVGVGYPFQDFRNIRDYYLQAKDALDLGKEKEPFKWVFRYENYQLESLLLRSKDNRSAESLMPEGLRLLQEYDRGKGTDYCQFLRFYIENSMNLSEAGRAFYLHRNTCIYRLNRIREITRLDLDDSETRFMLELAFGISDLEKS